MFRLLTPTSIVSTGLRSRATAQSTASMATALAPSALPQTYENALRLLSLLPTNKDITSLFTAATAPADLNARAIPEMREWLRRAGYEPSDLTALRCIHVAGTKGKGSVCAFLTALLTSTRDDGEYAAAGRVGTYMSPHVASVRERILLGGQPIGKELFAQYVFEVWHRLTLSASREGTAEPPGGYDGPATKPFYFRFLTLVAFHAFLSEGVRSAVVECGIGGEYDATNVLPAEAVTVAAVTRLGIDHVAMLGGTVEEIAWHKSGVFKHGTPAFTVRIPGQDGAMKVLRERAAEKGSRLVEIPAEDVEAWEGVPGARLGGAFQRYNMALAVAVAREHFRSLRSESQTDGDGGPKLDNIPAKWVEALKSATLRGRCETSQKGGVEWFLDGAHTADSLAEVSRIFMGKPRRKGECRILVFNQQDRDVVPLVKALVQGAGEGKDNIFDLALFTRNDVLPQTTRDTSAQEAAMEAARELSPQTKRSAWDNVTAAVEHIYAMAGEGQGPCRVIVTGSFHLVRSVLQVLDPGGVE